MSYNLRLSYPFYQFLQSMLRIESIYFFFWKQGNSSCWKVGLDSERLIYAKMWKWFRLRNIRVQLRKLLNIVPHRFKFSIFNLTLWHPLMKRQSKFTSTEMRHDKRETFCLWRLKLKHPPIHRTRCWRKHSLPLYCETIGGCLRLWFANSGKSINRVQGCASLV